MYSSRVVTIVRTSREITPRSTITQPLINHALIGQSKSCREKYIDSFYELQIQHTFPHPFCNIWINVCIISYTNTPSTYKTCVTLQTCLMLKCYYYRGVYSSSNFISMYAIILLCMYHLLPFILLLSQNICMHYFHFGILLLTYVVHTFLFRKSILSLLLGYFNSIAEMKFLQ